MTEAIVEKLTLKTRLGYGIGDIAICLYWSGVGLYLLYFYTDVVGISPSLAGLIYGIGMFWDAITDPLWVMLLKEPEQNGEFIGPIFCLETSP